MTSEPSCKDEARIGQKGELTRQWARRGTRPRQPRDQCYQAAYLFAAACPEAETTAALVLPQVNTEAMNLHLVEIAGTVSRQLISSGRTMAWLVMCCSAVT